MFKLTEQERASLKGFVRSKKNRQRILMVLIISVLLTGVAVGKGMAGDRRYTHDRKGHLIAVEKDRADETEVYSLHLKATKDGVTEDRDVTLTLRGKKSSSKKQQEESAQEEDPAASLTKDLDAMIRETEESGGKEVFLPESLPDGTRVKWSTARQTSPLVFLVFPVMIIAAMYGSYRKQAVDLRKAQAESVRRSIPVFTDQIMILLSCGLIFSDAFRRIAEGYDDVAAKKGFFEGMIVECQEIAVRTNRSLVRILNEQADRYRIREFTRIVGYISDNQYRGVDLSGKLETAGRELWEERKKQAEEKGRLAETRLTMPLALLLLVLILVTAAPAILQVKGV